jgi:hypothetical protein
MQEGKISYISLAKEAQQACKTLVESWIVIKILPLKCVDLTWNDLEPFCDIMNAVACIQEHPEMMQQAVNSCLN